MTPESERAFEAWLRAERPHVSPEVVEDMRDAWHARDEECERLRRERDTVLLELNTLRARAALQEGGEGR